MSGQSNGVEMHTEAYEFCKYAVNRISRDIGLDDLDVIDVGGRNVNGSIHHLFGEANITTTDIMDGDGVDFVADFSKVSIVDEFNFQEKFDISVSTEVLEHSPDWPVIVENMIAATKSGGWIIITCATDGRPPHSAIDGHYLTSEDNEYYGNVSEKHFLNIVEKSSIDILYVTSTTTHCDLQVLMRKH